MYESFFQLRQRPFAPAPCQNRYYACQATEAARQTLGRCLRRAEGAGLLLGAPGTGKSLVCRILAAELPAGTSAVLLAAGHAAGPRALLQSILAELSLPCRGLAAEDLRLILGEHVRTLDEQGKSLALIVDEAQLLSVRLLDELRLLTNLGRSGESCVRLLLSGGPQLEDRLNHPRLASLNQRITARCYVGPWNRSETVSYVKAQLAACGGDPQLFAAEALEAVFQATDGLPRLVNQTCDHSLILACDGGRRRISAANVEAAWADLQQLPAPWNGAATISLHRGKETESVIEFGALDTSGDERLDARPFVAAISPDGALPLSIHRSIDSLEAENLSALDDLDAPQQLDDPFAEPFANEEVIIDRYATFDAGFQGQVRVASAEGKALAALLLPVLASANKPRLASGTEAAVLPAAEVDPARRELPPPPEPSPIPLPSFNENLVADQDQILVEDDPDAAAEAASRTGPPARPKSYRQLFAQLRSA